MEINNEISGMSYIANGGICTTCNEKKAMILNGTLQQPCPDCATKQADEEINQSINKSRSADYKNLMDKKYIDCEWDVFNKGIPEQRFVARQCKDWADSFQLGKWLLLKGNQGTGKTLIKNLIIKQFSQSKKCTIKSTTGHMMYEKYIDVLNSGESLTELVKYYSDVELLLIDEIGRHSVADGFKNFLNQIIDNFYTSNKSLVVISNFELKREGQSINKYISDFIDIDRLNERALVVDFKYSSYRGK